MRRRASFPSTCPVASFLERDGELRAYGQDSAVAAYSYFHERLLDWLVDRLASQRDEGPLEDLSLWLERAGRPGHALISIGATRYTDYGERTFLRRGDRAIVVLYDGDRHGEAGIRALAADPAAEAPPGVSLLSQRVR